MDAEQPGIAKAHTVRQIAGEKSESDNPDRAVNWQGNSEVHLQDSHTHYQSWKDERRGCKLIKRPALRDVGAQDQPCRDKSYEYGSRRGDRRDRDAVEDGPNNRVVAESGSVVLERERRESLCRWPLQMRQERRPDQREQRQHLKHRKHKQEKASDPPPLPQIDPSRPVALAGNGCESVCLARHSMVSEQYDADDDH